MKKLLLTAIISMGIVGHSHAQYITATGPETSLGSPNPINGIYNVGIDSRGLALDTLYRNITNVMVSDYKFGGSPRFFWDIIGYSGSYPLAADAIDPDVTLIEGDVSNVWAIIVYYSPSYGGYCMSFSRISTTPVPPYTMLSLTTPVLFQPYTPTADYPPYINIDADDAGNYAVVFQMNGGIKCGTGTMSPGTFPPPPLPSNYIGYSTLIEPDVAINYTSATPQNIKIIALTDNRDGYVINERGVPPVTGSTYSSPLTFAHLYNPRIASTNARSLNYAFTMQQIDVVSGNNNILFDAYDVGLGGFFGIQGVNDMSRIGYPSANNIYQNAYPAISYHTYSGATSETISLAWYTSMLPAPPLAQTSTMMGLDIDASSLANLTGSNYLDISSSMTATNNVSTIGLSGRYSGWAKSAHFAYGTAAIPNNLVWKNMYSGTSSWRTINEGTTLSQADNAQLSLYPNPVSDQLVLNMNNDKNYAFKVYNSVGQVMTEGKLNQKANINVQDWSKGNYFIRLVDEISQEQQTQGFSKY